MIFIIIWDLTSALTITHDKDFANKTDRIIEIGDGRIIR